jgi:Trk K+ transport system NAD-binding subunit
LNAGTGAEPAREIAAELHASKTQVHRVIVRVRQQHAEAAERARLIAIADGRSLTQRDARAAKQPNAIRSRTTTPPVSSEPASGYGSP